ncbi:hypothetical protein, partial [Chitinophaga sp.]|uniref:hypothetical protein n=1 Tax=Chitinophaga sp. TaxID=1869181 RepID=UPI002F938997
LHFPFATTGSEGASGFCVAKTPLANGAKIRSTSATGWRSRPVYLRIQVAKLPVSSSRTGGNAAGSISTEQIAKLSVQSSQTDSKAERLIFAVLFGL